MCLGSGLASDASPPFNEDRASASSRILARGDVVDRPLYIIPGTPVGGGEEGGVAVDPLRCESGRIRWAWSPRNTLPMLAMDNVKPCLWELL
jgi:hypothetical protein